MFIVKIDHNVCMIFSLLVRRFEPVHFSGKSVINKNKKSLISSYDLQICQLFLFRLAQHWNTHRQRDDFPWCLDDFISRGKTSGQTTVSRQSECTLPLTTERKLTRWNSFEAVNLSRYSTACVVSNRDVYYRPSLFPATAYTVTNKI